MVTKHEISKVVDFLSSVLAKILMVTKLIKIAMMRWTSSVLAKILMVTKQA